MPTINMPQAGEAMRSGTVRRWLKIPGDRVARGDALVELDTEEGLVQVEAPVAGVLGQVLLAEGCTASIHAPLAIIEDPAATASGDRLAQDPDRRATPAAPAAAGPSAGSAGKVIPVLMPQAGQSMEEGTLVQWRVQVGAAVNKGDVLFEIETDKATMEVEATDSGRLARIVVPEGGVLAVLQPVAYLADHEADVEAYLAARATPAGPSVPPASPEEAGVVAEAKDMPTAPGGRVKASPAARRLAAGRGVDLGGIARGSGPGGRILSSDVPVQPVATGPAVGREPGTAGSLKRRRLSPMRKAIAKNLLLSKQTIPHFYVRLTLDAEPLLRFYQASKARFPCSINDVVVLACAQVLQESPAFRSRIEGDEIVEWPSANIGIAVSLEQGLVVPVVMEAERMDLRQLGATTRRLAETARGGRIEGMGQGCFTITNLGMFGTEEFAAIINPPESAILAVGAVREAVVVKDGAMRPGRVVTLTLSADHRVVDGVQAAHFLARLKELLEDPDRLA